MIKLRFFQESSNLSDICLVVGAKLIISIPINNLNISPELTLRIKSLKSTLKLNRQEKTTNASLKLEDTKSILIIIIPNIVRIWEITAGNDIPLRFIQLAVQTKNPFMIPHTTKFHPAPCQNPETKKVIIVAT